MLGMLPECGGGRRSAAAVGGGWRRDGIWGPAGRGWCAVEAGRAVRVRRAGALLRPECGRLEEYMGPACFVVLLSLLALCVFWRVLPASVRDWLAAFPERAGEPGPVELGMAVAACVLLGLYYLALVWAWVEEVWGRRRARGVRRPDPFSS